MRGGSIPSGRLRFLFNGNRAADLFPDTIELTRGDTVVVMELPNPVATQSFGQGTGIDYVAQSGDITQAIVDGQTTTVRLFKD